MGEITITETTRNRVSYFDSEGERQYASIVYVDNPVVEVAIPKESISSPMDRKMQRSIERVSHLFPSVHPLRKEPYKGAIISIDDPSVHKYKYKYERRKISLELLNVGFGDLVRAGYSEYNKTIYIYNFKKIIMTDYEIRAIAYELLGKNDD